jgi:hypothetical protein
LATVPRHERDELVVADLDELIRRRDLHGLAALTLRLDPDDLSEGLVLHTGQERLHDA